jgi:hypothetical protein
VEALLDQEVGEIAVSPTILAAPEWDGTHRAVLDAQLARIADLVQATYARAGTIPFLPFRRWTEYPELDIPGTATCGAVTACSPAVDVDGRVYACVSFAGWSKDGAADFACVGYIDAPDFAARLAAFRLEPATVPAAGGSPAGADAMERCAACPAAGACLICPAARVLASGALPLHHCDYLALVAKHSQRLPSQRNMLDEILIGLRRNGALT